MKENPDLEMLSEQYGYLDLWAREAKAFVEWTKSIFKERKPSNYTDGKTYVFYSGPQISILPAKWFVNYRNDISFEKGVNEIVDAFNEEMRLKDESSTIVIGKYLDDVNDALYALWKTNVNTADTNIDMYLLATCSADCSKTTIGILSGEYKKFFRNHCEMPPDRHIPIKKSRNKSSIYLNQSCALKDFGDTYRNLLVNQQIGEDQILYRLFNMNPTEIHASEAPDTFK